MCMTLKPYVGPTDRVVNLDNYHMVYTFKRIEQTLTDEQIRLINLMWKLGHDMIGFHSSQTGHPETNAYNYLDKIRKGLLENDIHGTTDKKTD